MFSILSSLAGDSLNTQAYLERINYYGPITPSASTLRALHLAHLLTVPFENLSIHAGDPIVLDDAALFTKIVERRRGGFCYEANGLFAALLRALGFKVTMLSAEVAGKEGGSYSPPFDHMALMIALKDRWLADVGFGDSFHEPLLLDEQSEQLQAGDAFKITQDDAYRVLMRREQGEWKPQYRFTLHPYEYADFAEMCRYHQTSPESHFTQKRLCSRATETGRVTLSDMRLIESTGDRREERVLSNHAEYGEILREKFGVVMNDS
jgi:N-hydroxyarylamine O-acetyltransferase